VEPEKVIGIDDRSTGSEISNGYLDDERNSPLHNAQSQRSL
jgi:hypothetical protein